MHYEMCIYEWEEVVMRNVRVRMLASIIALTLVIPQVTAYASANDVVRPLTEEEIVTEQYTSDTEAETDSGSDIEESYEATEESSVEESEISVEESADSENEDNLTAESTIEDVDISEKYEVDTPVVSVSGNNSIGEALAAAIEAYDAGEADAGEDTLDPGYSVSKVTMEGDTVKVEYHATDDATLIVGIYDETTKLMVSSGTTNIDSESKEVSFAISALPDSYIIRAYIVESDTLRPLSKEYENDDYTAAWQDFHSKTTDDFAVDKVYNLDDDKTDNFIVANDDNTIIHETETVNRVLSADNESDTYVIEDIDDTVRGLAAGQIVTILYGDDDISVTKIKSIDITEDTATIAGEDIDFEDAFDYIRINIEEYAVDTPEEGELDPVGWEDENSLEIKIGKIPGTELSVTGNMKVKTNITWEVGPAVALIPIRLNKLDVEFETEASLNVTGELASKSIDVPLTPTPIGINTKLITVEFVPRLVFSGKVEVTGTFAITGKNGFIYQRGAEKEFQLINEIDFKVEAKISAEVSVELVIGPEIEVDEVLDLKLTAALGAKISATVPLAGDRKCRCAICVDGEISVYAKVAVQLVINKKPLDNLNKEYTLTLWSKDFYYSLDLNPGFGWGDCPNTDGIDVTVHVENRDGTPAVAAYIGDKKIQTDSKGNAIINMPVGNAFIYAFNNTYKAYGSTFYRVSKDDTFARITLGTPAAYGKVDDAIKGDNISTLSDTNITLINDSGELFMLGEGDSGELGNGKYEDSDTIATKVDIPGKIKYVTGNGNTIAAINNKSELYAWGNNGGGVLTEDPKNVLKLATPKKISLSNVTDVSMGSYHAAAVAGGQVYTWGYNGDGQLGIGTEKKESLVPVAVDGMYDIKKVFCGNSVTMALTDEDDLYIWGWSGKGQCGLSGGIREKPLAPILRGVDEMGTCYDTIWALKDGDLYTWGGYDYAANGTTEDTTTPVKIDFGGKKVSKCMGWGAIMTDGSAYVWGSDVSSAFGSGDTGLTPVKVECDKKIKMLTRAGEILTTDGYVICKKDKITKDYGASYIFHLSASSAVTSDGLVWVNRDKVIFKHMPDGDDSMSPSGVSEDTESDLSVSETSDAPVFGDDLAELKPNMIYNFYYFRDSELDNRLDSDNLCYVGQLATDADGALNIDDTIKDAYSECTLVTVSAAYNKKASKTGMWVEDIDEEFTYTGKNICPEVRVYDGEKLLTKNVDYKVTYARNKLANDGTNEATAPTVIITGKGNYSSTEKTTFAIKKKDISDEDVIISDIPVVAESGTAYKPSPTVKYNGMTLKKGEDYRITYHKDRYDSQTVIPKAAGTYYAKITATEKNYTFIAIKQFEISAKNTIPVSKLTIKKIAPRPYDDTPYEPDIIVMYKDRRLNKGVDYEVEYLGDHTSVGTAKLRVTGVGEKYVGSRIINYSITGTALSKSKMSGLVATYRYDGEKKLQTGLVLRDRISDEVIQGILKADYELLSDTAKKDYGYTIEYVNNVNAGKASVVLTGVNGYVGKVIKKYTISPYNINPGSDTGDDFTISLSEDTLSYCKSKVKPAPIVKYKGVTLTKGVDYTVTYEKNAAVYEGTDPTKLPTVIIQGKGNFTGKDKTCKFKIRQRDIDDGSVIIDARDVAFINSKNKWKAIVNVIDVDGKVLKNGVDYNKVTFSYEDGSAIGAKDIPVVGTKIKVSVTGIRNYTGTVYGEYAIVKSDISKLTVKVKAKTYTGSEIKIDKSDITFKSGSKTVEGVTYEIDDDTYANNVNKGNATVIIRGTDEYGGYKKISYQIKSKGFLWWWR